MTDPVRVLHVDDDETFLDLTATFLRQVSDRFEVETATRADDGLDALRAADGGIDCVVTDYALPDMDGLDFLDAVREEHPDLPVLFFTGRGSEEVASKALSGGATGYLQKQSGTEQYDMLANRIRNAVEQARAERDRRTMRERMEFALGETRSIIFEIDPETRRETRHGPFEKLYGIASEAVPTTDEFYRRAVHPEDRKRVERRQESAMESREGEPQGVEYRTHPDNGEVRWLLSRIHVTRGPDGDVNRIVGLSTDVTDRKERERELRESERYRRELYRITSDTEAGVEEKIQRLLELGCERLGVENGHVTTIDREENRQRIRMAAGSGLVRPGMVTDLGETFCRKTVDADDLLTVYNAPEDGWEDDPAYEKWGIGCYVGARIEVDDELFGTVCFVDRDPREEPFTEAEQAFVDLLSRWLSHVFERRQYRRELREYERVVDAVPDSVYVLDGDFEFAVVNDAMTALTGYSREELVGSDASLVFEPGTIDAWREEGDRLGSGEREFESLETEIRAADGESIPCEVRGRVVRGTGDGEDGIIGVIRETDG